MLGHPKGYIFIKQKLEHTREPGLGPHGVDLTKYYFDALQMKLLPVMDIAIDNSSYLVLGDSPEVGKFLWDVDKKDTTGEMIPYKLLHPGLDWKDILGMLERIEKGKWTPEDLKTLSSEVERLARDLGIKSA